MSSKIRDRSQTASPGLPQKQQQQTATVATSTSTTQLNGTSGVVTAAYYNSNTDDIASSVVMDRTASTHPTGSSGVKLSVSTERTSQPTVRRDPTVSKVKSCHSGISQSSSHTVVASMPKL